MDLDGRRVKPKGNLELDIIKNTLPKGAREYVRLNSTGFIDQELINSANITGSQNFNNLLTLVNSSEIIEVESNKSFIYLDQEGNIGKETMSYIPFDCNFPEDKDVDFKYVNGLSTGEMGLFGKVLFPDKDGLQNSTNNNIKIIINSSLSLLGAAESFSHEGYGHALLYVINGGNHDGASHNLKSTPHGPYDSNDTLKKMILNSRK